MKKLGLIAFVFAVLFFMPVTVSAQQISDEEYDEYINDLSKSLKLDELYESLSEESKKALAQIGVSNISANSLSQISFSDVMGQLSDMVLTQSGKVFSSLGIITAVLLLYALSEGFMQNLTADTMREVLSVVCALCMAGVLVMPVSEVIDAADSAIKTASDFMLSFIPVMVTVLVSCGKTLAGSGYYSLMIFVAEAISQLCSKLITPMLNVFLGVSICSAVVPQLKLQSMTDLFSKTIKWLLSFSFTIFSALLTFRTLIATSIDSVSTRAVRFTMSSFIPVVGAALSEAYKTVQGSVNVLKNGIGVFVIFAVAIVFLPIIIRLMLWNFSISLCKTISQVLSISIPGEMLKSLSTVLSVLLAVVLCIMALFIISTALIITAGGLSA